MAEETPQEQINQEKAAKHQWTRERCLKAARRYSSEQDWKAGAPSSYKAAFAKDWVADCTAHMGAVKQRREPKSA